MPSVVINEKDFSVFNIYLNNDNIVWIPGFSITGPYDTPRLLNSHADLVATYGDRPPAESYSSSATSDTYRLCTGWDFAAQMLRKGFRVLFQRVAPFTYDGDGNLTDTVDGAKLRSASTNINYSADLIPDYIVVTGAFDPSKTYYTKSGDNYIQYSGYFQTSGDYDSGKTYYTNNGGTYTQYSGYFQTTDTEVDSGKTYYSDDQGTTVSPTGEENPSQEGWYEQGFAPDTLYYEQGFESGVTYYTKEVINENYKFGLVGKYGGTYGNRLAVIFTANVNRNKLFLKVVDVLTSTVLEYKEICPIKFVIGDNDKINTIDPEYILTFGRGLLEAIGTSDYIDLDTTLVMGATRLADLGSINTYIVNTLSSDTGTFSIDSETGTIVYTRNPEAADPDEITIADNNLFNKILVNANASEQTILEVRSTMVLGKSVITTGKKEIKFEDPIVEGVLGKDFTVNDALDTTNYPNALTLLADTLVKYLETISDKILYDVKYITLGNIYYTSDLIPSSDKYGTVYNAVADICALRGDCVAILNPDFRKTNGATEVREDFSVIGGKPSSYASVFAPWAVMGIYNSNKVWCSPAMVFLTALADSVANGNPVYLPPAGVNRATIPDIVKTEYMIGSTVLDDWQNKDKPVNINPIMFLNTYGYVIFGQRTLYDVSDELVGTRSALQELGVRLTVLECKKEIRKVAIGLLFEYNNIHTWNAFKAGLRPLFDTMISNGALNKYQIIMDETTNSPDDIDDNTLRGIVKIIPGRAVEDVIISFEIYRNGVTFDDEEPNN